MLSHERKSGAQTSIIQQATAAGLSFIR
jgi:hypothetical protein